MNETLMILVAVGNVGAFDVLYYHLYRFRLFARQGSVAEEVTHLFRHAIFVALLLLFSGAASFPARDALILGLFALDMVNSVADVLLERRSREPLGGLPSGEYLVHILSTFGMGLAVATFVILPHPSVLKPPSGMLAWQVRGMLAAGVAIFLVEATLFARAVSNPREPARSFTRRRDEVCRLAAEVQPT